MACVSVAWARAATAPAVWRDIRFASPHATRIAPLTDDRLAALVARAGGALRSLDVTGCVELTDAGIAAALSHVTSLRRVKLCAAQPPASKYAAPRKTWDYGYDCEVDAFTDSSGDEGEAQARTFEERELGPTQLSAAGIAAALLASAPLEELCVDGLVHGPDNAHFILDTLLPLVGGDASRLDVVLCGSDKPYWAFASRSAGEEDNFTFTRRVRLRDGVPDEHRCHMLRTRLEAACAARCQGCNVAYCAHVRVREPDEYYATEPIQICNCNQRMCYACREDCAAD